MKKFAALVLLASHTAWAQLAPAPGLYDANGNPVLLGQTTMSSSLPIAISSNQSALPVSQSGTWTNTVSGSITANQGGTWTVQQGTPPWSVSQSGTWNVNNITGTVSLPTGASTSALQTTGNTSIASVVTNTNGLSHAQGSTTTGQVGNLDMGAVTTAAPIYTTGQINPLSLDTSGNLRVNLNATNVIQPVSQSGTWTVQQGTPPWSIVGNVGQGTADSGNGVKFSAVANTNEDSLPTVANGQRIDAQADLNGRIYVLSLPNDGGKDSYAASTTLVPGAAATDVFTITGSATKTIRITHIILSAVANTQIDVSTQLIKRSAADTGGTSTAPTRVPYDSTNLAATAVVAAYTANPTLGTAVGTLATFKLSFVLTTSAAADILLEYGNRPTQAIVLRGAAQQLAINLNGTTITAGSLSITIEWTEE